MKKPNILLDMFNHNEYANHFQWSMQYVYLATLFARNVQEAVYQLKLIFFACKGEMKLKVIKNVFVKALTNMYITKINKRYAEDETFM